MQETPQPEFLTLSELEARAQEVLPREAWDYATGGSGSETTLRRNRRALERLAIQQSILVDVRTIDLTTELLGVPLPSPVLIAPMGALYRFHPEGDLEMARGAGRDGSMFCLSGVTGWPVEEVIAAGGGAPLMFQIYHHGDRDWAEEYICGRVQRAGFRAMALTVDTALYSRRERDLHNRFAARVRRPGTALPDPTYPARLTWDDVRWLRERSARTVRAQRGADGRRRGAVDRRGPRLHLGVEPWRSSAGRRPRLDRCAARRSRLSSPDACR